MHMLTFLLKQHWLVGCGRAIYSDLHVRAHVATILTCSLARRENLRFQTWPQDSKVYLDST